jgi:CopG antitoxin of type II toxin-antitoxin system
MKADEFDTRFDNGEDMTDFLDLSQIKRSGYEQKSIDIDFPTWMIEALDQEAKRLGVTRQSIIKIWIADRLSHLPR